MKKVFVAFLVVNFLVGVGLFVNFQKKEENAFKVAEENRKKEEERLPQEEEKRKNELAVCIQFGPFNIDEKSSFDLAVNKSNVITNNPNDLIVAKTNLYQLYWDLGNNEKTAQELFEKQKRGALSDEKFQLSQNEKKHWVVNITEAAGSEELAKTLTEELAEKAELVNAGGTWSYKQLNDAYFYRFDKFNMVENQVQEELITISGNKKQPCVE